MNKTRRMLVAGLGAMTPAFIATIEDVAIAPAQSGATAIALDQETLKRALLGLSPAEKLRIAGDRIRLAKSKVQSTQHTAGRTNACVTAGTCGGAPRRAR